MRIALCTIVAHNIAQNRPDNFPPYPSDNHHCSDDVYLRDGDGFIGNVLLSETVKEFWKSVVRRSYRQDCRGTFIDPQWPTLPYLRGGWVLATQHWGHNRIGPMRNPQWPTTHIFRAAVNNSSWLVLGRWMLVVKCWCDSATSPLSYWCLAGHHKHWTCIATSRVLNGRDGRAIYPWDFYYSIPRV